MADALTRRLAVDLDRAFPDVVDAHGPMVLAILTRLGDAAEAEDLCQDVFARAYAALEGYGPERIAQLALRPWLVTLARNALRNEHRRRGRKPTVPLAGGEGEQPRSSIGQPERDAVDRDQARDLEALIRRLPDRQQQVVVLRHVAGLTTREVAGVLGCPEGTVKSELSRGLARLRELVVDQRRSEERL